MSETLMTFSEMVTATPKLYDNIAVDDATKDSILSWFQFRYVCDNDKFPTFFRRELSLDLDRYNALIRVDLTKIDPMVSSYRERQLIHTGTSTETGSGSDKTEYAGSLKRVTEDGGTESVSAVRTPDLTETSTPGVTDTDKTEYGSKVTRKNDGTETPDTTETTTRSSTDGGKAVQKAMPQSMAYSGQSGGEIPALDWQYPSSQAQDEKSHSGTDTTTRTGETTKHDEGSETRSGADTRTLSHTGSDTRKNTGTEKSEGTTTFGKTVTTTETPVDKSETKTATSSKSNTDDSEDKEIWTGRDGLTPQEALQKMREYIKASNAFEWLKWQLETCFLGIYEV